MAVLQEKFSGSVPGRADEIYHGWPTKIWEWKIFSKFIIITIRNPIMWNLDLAHEYDIVHVTVALLLK